jgi:hypothetical protein
MSRLIGSGTDHRAVSAPSYDYGFAAQLRIVPLLNGRIKGVHVDVHYLADLH